MSSLRIQAEDYTSFDDRTANNKGGAYRNDSVDIGISDSNPDDVYVGWIQSGESLGFQVDASKSGTYRLEARVASARGGRKQFNVIADGQQTAEFMPINTGNWYSFENISAGQTFSLTKGSHDFKVDMVTGGFNFDYFDLVFVDSDSSNNSNNSNSGTGSEQSGQASSGTNSGGSTNSTSNNANNSQLIRIQAEDYTSFDDRTAGNKGGAYRNDSVDIGISDRNPDDVYVGWIQSGESLGFKVDISKSGTYRLKARVASAKGGNKQFNVIADGQQTAKFMPGNTGNWYSFENTSANQTFSLTKGSHDFKVDMVTGGFNLDYFDLVFVGDEVASPDSPASIELNLGKTVKATTGQQTNSGNSTARSVDYTQLTTGITANLSKSTVSYDIRSGNGASLRIMPLGDSLTQGGDSFDPGGYRDDLVNALNGKGYNVDAVGNRSTGSGFDADHAGVPGDATSDIAIRVGKGLIEDYPADAILLMVGTNDNLQTNRFATLDGALERLDNLVSDIIRRAPSSRIFLASITAA